MSFFIEFKPSPNQVLSLPDFCCRWKQNTEASSEAQGVLGKLLLLLSLRVLSTTCVFENRIFLYYDK